MLGEATTSVIKVATAMMLACCFSGLVQATKIYTWTDENGQKHFSQMPPPDNQINAQTLSVRGPSTSTDGEQKAKEDALNKLGDKVDEATAARKDGGKDADKRNTKMTAEACQQARSRLKAIKETPRLYHKGEDGQVHWYSEEEKKDLLRNSLSEAKDFCGKN